MPSRLAALLTSLTLTASGLALVPTVLTTPEAEAAAEEVFVNEIHYATSGVDTGEFVEVAGPAGADLTGLSVVLYDGDSGVAYDARQLTGALGVNGVAVVDYPAEGVQDGPADAVALVDGATVVQFLSWGGVVTAADGPAVGQTSSDIGVSEGPDSPAGSSLQLTGTGDQSSDFRWTGPAPSSPGAPNEGQTLTSGPDEPAPTDADLLEPGTVIEKTVPPSDTAIEQIIEGESLSDSIPVTDAPSGGQESTNGASFSGDSQLRVNADKVGDSATATFQVPRTGRYRIWADRGRGANFGFSTLAIDGVVLGEVFDGSLASGLRVERRVPYGELYLTEGSHTLTLTVVGKGTFGGQFGGFFIGLDLLRLRLMPDDGRLTMTPQRGDSVHGLVPVYGWSTDPADQLRVEVDRQDVIDWEAFGDPATLVFEASGVQAGPPGVAFADGISVRGQELFLNKDIGTATAYWTASVELSGELLYPGENPITLFTGADPADPAGAKDAFNVRNVRLVLSDGTVLQDPSIDPTTVVPLSDTTTEQVFRFTVPPAGSGGPDHTNARGYLLDTQGLSDGGHTVSLIAEGPGGTERLSYRVDVDNGAPIVSGLVPAKGARVKGDFTLDAVVTDDDKRRPTVTATLDHAEVRLGTRLSTDDLAAGPHVFTVTAVDSAGNNDSEVTEFATIPQTPYAPQLVGPADGGQLGSLEAQLQVTASDPDEDPLQVTFLQATPQPGAPLLAAGGTTPRDLPAPSTGGGTPLDPAAVADSDDVYADSPATSDVPYQRFDIGVSKVRGAKQVDVSWEGKVTPDREIVLSVWDLRARTWVEVASARGAAEGDTTVVGTTALARTMDGERVHVLVHGRDPFDEVPTQTYEQFEDPSTYDFSIAWLTDTQYLTDGGVDGRVGFGEAFIKINEWIRDNSDERKIVYAAHTGDIIENWFSSLITPTRATREFQFASNAMKILDDAGVPNGVIPGNHDNKTGWSNVLYNQFFPPSRYDAAEEIAPTGEDGEGYYGGSWKPDDNQNHYDLIEAGGQKLIFLYLGFGIGPTETDWANQVLAEYRDRKAVVLTHSYLLPSETSDGRLAEYTPGEGLALFDKVVLPNENVFLTLSGHVHGVALNIKRDTGVKGRAVVEIVSNYQFYEIEGERRIGHLRLLQFNTEEGNIAVDTYSPILDDFNATEFDTRVNRAYLPMADEYTVPVDLETRTTEFRTDAIGLALRTKTVVGQASVASGETAAVTWRGLAANTRYGWYARATDQYGVSSESTVFMFRTGPS